MMKRHQIRTEPTPGGRASRRATAIALLLLVTVGGAAVWMTTAGAAGVSEEGRLVEPTTFPREAGIGACLQVAQPVIDHTEWIADALSAEASAREYLFPEPGTTLALSSPEGEATIVALWPNGAPADSEAARLAMRKPGACLAQERGWTFAVTHALLADGADRLLERADFGAEWSGSIEVAFVAEETRVRSTLHFSGPFGINGSCWLDETLFIDPDSGLPGVVTTSGDEAGLPGLVACRRFEDELSEGGAGALAVALFPTTLASDTNGPAMYADAIEVTDELLVVRGGTR